MSHPYLYNRTQNKAFLPRVLLPVKKKSVSEKPVAQTPFTWESFTCPQNILSNETTDLIRVQGRAQQVSMGRDKLGGRRPGDPTPSLFDSAILVQLPSSTFSSDKWRATAVITLYLRIASSAELYHSSSNNDSDNDDNHSYHFLCGRHCAKSDLHIVAHATPTITWEVAHATPTITWEEVLWLSPVYKLNGESLNLALSTRSKQHLVGHRATSVETSPSPIKNSLIWQTNAKQEPTNKKIMPQRPASASKGIANCPNRLQHSTTRTIQVYIYYLRVCVLSHVQLFGTPWTIACQAPLSMEFSRQEYWSGLPFLSLGDLPDPGIKPTSLASPALAADSLPLAPLGKPYNNTSLYLIVIRGLKKNQKTSK